MLFYGTGEVGARGDYFLFLNKNISNTGNNTISDRRATNKVRQVNSPKRRMLSKSDKIRLMKPPNRIRVVKNTGLPVSV